MYEIVVGEMVEQCGYCSDSELHTHTGTTDWSAEVGTDNEFATVEEAEAAIPVLAEHLDGERTEYRVREIGARWPL